MNIPAAKHSASRSLFKKTVELEQKLSRLIFFVAVEVTLGGFLVPWSIYSFFIYFTTDSGKAAFDLPLPIWYASHSKCISVDIQKKLCVFTGCRSIGDTPLDIYWLLQCNS